MSAVHNNLAASRFDIYSQGTVAASAHYRMNGGEMSFIYTEVNRQIQTPALVRQLIQGCLDDAHRRRLAVLPFCPVMLAYIRRHVNYVELVPPAQRQRFRLSTAKLQPGLGRLVAVDNR